MCAPDRDGEDEETIMAAAAAAEDNGGGEGVAGKNGSGAADAARSALRRGEMLGGASLALLFLAYSLTMPYQQSKRDELGCESMCLGSLSSGKSTMKLLGATVLGRLSDAQQLADRTGKDRGAKRQSYTEARRICLWLGILGAAMTLTMECHASSITDLWRSLVPAGLLEQNSHILKAVFGDYHKAIPGGSTPGERASSAGMVGLSIGVAMMIGPMIGSSPLLTSYEDATKLAVALLTVSAALVAMLPTPESLSSATKKKPEFLKKKSSIVNILDVPSARTPAGIVLLSCRLLSALSYHIYQTIFMASLRERFHFGRKEYGIFFSVIGLFFALSQGFLSKLFLDRFGRTDSQRARFLVICTFLIGIQRYFAFYTTDLVLLYVSFAVMVVAYGVTSTVFASDTSQVAAPEELGAFFGLVAAVESGAGMAGPLLGGALTYWHPTRAPLLASIGINGLCTFLLASSYETVVLGHFEDASSKQKQT